MDDLVGMLLISFPFAESVRDVLPEAVIDKSGPCFGSGWFSPDRGRGFAEFLGARSGR